MKFQVDMWNNFCRVFELPENYPQDFCFDGGLPVNFQMVDWFDPVQGVGRAVVTKEVWEETIGAIEVEEVNGDELAAILIPFLQRKQYVKPKRVYIILCEFGAVFLFSKEEPCVSKL